MHLLLTILVFFLIFSLLIVIHELGHFMMARRHGVKVEEFGFGLPPKLWSKKVGETEYSINAIPFGGFVRLLGEDSHDKKAKTSPKSFSRKTLFQRFQIVFAGVAMNFLLAWLLLSIGFTVGMQPLLVNDKFVLGEWGLNVKELQQLRNRVDLSDLFTTVHSLRSCSGLKLSIYFSLSPLE